MPRRQLMLGVTALVLLAITGIALATGLANRRAGAEPARDSVRRADPALGVIPGCPARSRGALRSATPGAQARLVPAGARRILLCRYGGFGANSSATGPRSTRLIAHHLVTGRGAIAGLARRLNLLDAAQGAQACPADRGATVVAWFGYGSASEPDDPVTIHLGGCSIVTNGHLKREAEPELVLQLEALTPSPRRGAGPYWLYTHCGITWAKIRGTFWRAVTPLSDGQGNPPAGWGNPYQAGTLTVTGPSTAVFRSPAGTVDFARTARTRVPLVCA